jgi:glycosyltransferase involved in cell wall biosynthesis
LRVIHLANYGGPYPGSFIPMVEAAARAVRERGGEATLAFSESARERSWMRQLEAGQVPVAVAPRGDDRAKARWIAELAGNGDHPTILHTHFTTFDLPALRAARGRPRTAVLWNMHTSLRQERSMRLRNSAKFALAGRRVAAIVCVGESIAAEVGARHAPSGRVVVLQNAIDVERFPPIDAARRSEARRRLGLDEGLPVLLHFGWDWHVKGGDLLAGAVQRLARVGPVAALSVGCDPKVVAAQSERLGLPEGALRVLEPTDDVAGLYAAADVFAATSRAEAFSFAAVEAVASGLPVVATDIPAHATIAREIGNVRLVPHDPDAVAGAVRETLARDPADAAEDAARGRARVAERMDLASWSRRLMELYERALQP